MHYRRILLPHDNQNQRENAKQVPMTSNILLLKHCIFFVAALSSFTNLIIFFRTK